MTDRPILFSAPMVRALLAGSKTQTRRPLKIQPLDILPMQGDAAGREWVALMTRDPEPKGTVLRCRYGVPGDRLYVRETWQAVNGNDRARHIVTHPAPDRGWIEYAATPRIDEPAYKWRPSIHMPRWASRITLEVTGVRVERLQDISEADAIAEGGVEVAKGWWSHDGTTMDTPGDTHFGGTAVDSYRVLWDRINGAGSWESNPFVWVISFQRTAQ